MVSPASLARIRKQRFLDEKWDWREHGVLHDDPPTQKPGTCWAYAVVAAVEADLQMQRISEKPSVQELIDCCRVPGGTDGGNIIAAFQHIKNRGITTTTDYPTSLQDQVRCKRCHERIRPKVKIQNISFVKDMSERGLMNAVKERPVVVTFFCSDEFSEYSKEDNVTCKGLYPSELEDKASGHVDVLVGYGTEESDDGGVGEPYWILRNSWGPEWGDKGCMKLHRDLTNMFGYAVYSEGAFVMPAP